jgi:nucleoside phosphorylase
VKVLVTFAVEAEFGPWRSRHRFTRCRPTREPFAPRSEAGEPWEAAVGDRQQPLYEASFDDAAVTVLLTGVGSLVSRCNMTEMFIHRAMTQHSFAVCVSAGLAGALRPGLRIGEVLVARYVHSDAREGEGFAPPKLAMDQQCARVAQHCGATVIDRFLTSDHIVRSAAEKRSLSAEADAVEMESYGVLSEASAWGVRCAAVRAVSDDTAEDLPIDFRRTIDARGQIRYSRIAGELVRHPSALPGLLRFGRHSRAAAQKLAEFLDRYIPALAAFLRGAGLEYSSVVAAR